MMFFHAWIHATVTAPIYATEANTFFVFSLSNGTLLISLFAIILFSAWVSSRTNHRVFSYALALMGILGTLLMGFENYVTQVSNVPVILGTIATACSTGGLLAMWGEGYVRLVSPRAQIVATFSAIIGSFFLYLFVNSLPDAISIVLTALFPAVSVLCLRHVLRSERIEFMPEQEQSIRSYNPPRKLLIYIIVFSVPINFLNMQISSTGAVVSSSMWSLVYSCVLLIIGMSIFVEIVLEKRKTAVLSVITVLLTTGSLLLYLFASSSSNLTLMHILMYSGYYLFVATFYSFLGMVASVSKRNPFQTFAIGNLVNAFGLILGTFLGFVVGGLVPPWPIIATITIVYALFFIGFIFMPQAKRNIFAIGNESIAPIKLPAYQSIAESVQNQCHNAAKSFGLSKREEEILSLLIRGRNIQTIADEIILSQNTVKTHVNHIYQKLDVHTREELIITIERVEIPQIAQ